mmetsp:Transcript_7815/g.33210  ORF Transcript_7815/g.33210 Transcript_7815/m.33210 type:complete len:250 (-) Transcript_7815:30-779(-)
MRVTGPKGRNSSCRSCSRVSSERLETRTLFSSLRRFMESPMDAPAPAPARMEGGTYPPLLGALGSSSPGGFSDPNPSVFIAARSLYGHFVVQWSPFLPQMRHTNNEVFPVLAIAASASPDFSDSLLGVARARSRKISSMETAVMDSSPGLYRCASPNLAHFLRANIAFVTFFVAVCTRVFFVVLILLPSSFWRYSTTVLTPFASGPVICGGGRAISKSPSSSSSTESPQRILPTIFAVAASQAAARLRE